MSACHSDDESQGVTAVTFHHSGGVRMEDDKGGLSCGSGWGAKIKCFLHPACLLSERYVQNVYVADFYLRSRCRGRPNLGLKDHFGLFADLRKSRVAQSEGDCRFHINYFKREKKKHVTKTTTLTPKYSHVKKNVYAGLYAAQYEKLSTFLLPP